MKDILNTKTLSRLTCIPPTETERKQLFESICAVPIKSNWTLKSHLKTLNLFALYNKISKEVAFIFLLHYSLFLFLLY